MILNDRFFVLKRISQGDSNFVLKVFSRSYGKLTLIARGAARSVKRFGGGILEPPCLVDGVIKKSSREGQIHLLNEAKLVNAFEGLRKNFDQIETALAFMKSVDRLTEDEDSDSLALFQLLGNSLIALESCTQPNLLKVHFQVRLLALLGVLPRESDYATFLTNPVMKWQESQIDANTLKSVEQRMLDCIESIALRR